MFSALLFSIVVLTLDYVVLDTLLFLLVWVLWVGLGCLCMAVAPKTRRLAAPDRVERAQWGLLRSFRRVRWLSLLVFLWPVAVSWLMDGALVLRRRHPARYRACFCLTGLAGLALLIKGSWDHDDLLFGALALLFWLSVVHLAISREDVDTDGDGDGDDRGDGPGPEDPMPTGDVAGRRSAWGEMALPGVPMVPVQTDGRARWRSSSRSALPPGMGRSTPAAASSPLCARRAVRTTGISSGWFFAPPPCQAHT